MEPVVAELLDSPEPSIRWLVRTRVLGEPADGPGIRALRKQIRDSPRVRALLAGRDAAGRLTEPADPYSKWRGAHWVLLALAGLGYPAGDRALAPLREQVLDRWLTRGARTDRVVAGRHRRCGSQQGGALLAVVRLGLADDRTPALVDLLLRWQWPDGGWNCDRRPEARMASVAETLLPLRGLTAYAGAAGAGAARAAADRAADFLLDRRLGWRRTTGEPIHDGAVLLHYPLYWHYDVLGALAGMAELGRLDDPRCADALDLLESKRLPDGGWPAEGRYWTPAAGTGRGRDRVDWGPTRTGRRSDWVTAHALAVLAAAGRLAA